MYTVTTMTGTRDYDVATQAEALREHIAAFPGEPVLGVSETFIRSAYLTMD